MRKKCDECKGRGMIQREGRGTVTKKPYDLVCPVCNGRGHHEA
jgi:DnaJ-class molecular chaperone